jgi:hypothetical protein
MYWCKTWLKRSYFKRNNCCILKDMCVLLDVIERGINIILKVSAWKVNLEGAESYFYLLDYALKSNEYKSEISCLVLISRLMGINVFPLLS